MNIPALRLSSHNLHSPTLFRSPKDVITCMCAMQAQDFNMAKWGVGIRMNGCTDEMVQTAFESGEIIRTHIMRPTWHFVTPEDITWILPLSSERIISSMKSRDVELGLNETIYAKSVNVIIKALEGGKHLTREELSEIIGRAGIAVNSARMVHFMIYAEQRGIVCSGAMRDKQHTYALFDERVPHAKSLSKDDAIARLAARYFAGHAPACLQDFAWWSGLPASEARAGIEAIKSNLIAEIIDSQTYFLPCDFKPQIEDESCHILPAFDEYLIAYRNRTAVLSPENHDKAISSNGVFRPVIIRNGKVSGLWKNDKKQSVKTEFFKKPNGRTKELLDKAIEDYRRFLNEVKL